MTNAELIKICDEINYVGISSPAWAGHTYATEYDEARKALQKLEAFEETYNPEKARQIHAYLEETSDFEDFEKYTPKVLEEYDKQFWNLFDSCIEDMKSVVEEYREKPAKDAIASSPKKHQKYQDEIPF